MKINLFLISLLSVFASIARAAGEPIAAGTYTIAGTENGRVIVDNSSKVSLRNYWLYVPAYSRDSNGDFHWFSFRITAPHRPLWNEELQAWTTLVVMNGYVYDDSCEYQGSLAIRAYDESRELEIAITHPTRMYSTCSSFGNARELLVANKIQP